MTSTPKTRCALVALIGQPNAGKSTLLNALVGARVAIVSDKPNTTRMMVRGAQTLGETQIVWLDTPGLVNGGSRSDASKMQRGFDRTLQQQAESAMAEADVLVVVADIRGALRDFSTEERWITQAAKAKQPVVLALTKTDLVKDKKQFLPLLERLNTLPVAAVVLVATLRNQAVPEVAKAVAKLAPVGPHLFPSDMLTDQPLPERLAELTREQVLRLMNAEVPYGATVITEAIMPPGSGDAGDDAPMLVQQMIVVPKNSHKPMMLGEGGQMIKKIGTQARHAMQQALGQGVRLELRVVVRTGK
jgi:GTP-binding protein Era